MKLKAGDNISREDILSCFNANKARYPFKKEQSRIELLSCISPSCCLSSTNQSRVSNIFSWRKELYKEAAYSHTRCYGHVTTWQYFQKDIQNNTNHGSYSARERFCLSRKAMWSSELRHEPNFLTRDVHLNKRNWQHGQTSLCDQITNHARNDRNMLGY